MTQTATEKLHTLTATFNAMSTEKLRWTAEALLIGLEEQLPKDASGKTTLSNAQLKNAKLNGAQLKNAKLEGANLEGANLKGAKLHSADLNNAMLNGANLISAILYHANLNDANLSNAKLNAAMLNGTSFYRANLNNTNLYRASLNGANLNGANLNNANLNGTNLTGATLPLHCLYQTGQWEGANLTNIHLTVVDKNNRNITLSQEESAVIIAARMKELDVEVTVTSLRPAAPTGTTPAP